MKLIIAGGRDYQMTGDDKTALLALDIEMGITEVVSGCARGADQEGEKWAEANGIPVKRFPAKWRELGKSAGHHRNTAMACYAEALAVFPGGRGTADMIQQARERGLPIINMGGLAD